MNYENVYLVPNKRIVKSRNECDTSCSFLDRVFTIPVIPANMPCVLDIKNVETLIDFGAPYIYSRYAPAWRGIETVKKLQQFDFVSISVGLKDIDFIKECKKQNLSIHWFTIDVAHGHADDVSQMADEIRTIYPLSKIIVGNLGSKEGIKEMSSKKNIDAIKVGIAKGGACSTYGSTGFCTPMFSLALAAGEFSSKPVIIDGGIRQYGDIAKALVGFYSAQENRKRKTNCLVMAGGFFASCEDSPAEIIDKRFKEYYGNASAQNKNLNKQSSTHPEGFTTLLPIDMSYEEKLQQTKEHLQSAISYAGGKDIYAFKSVLAYTS